MKESSFSKELAKTSQPHFFGAATLANPGILSHLIISAASSGVALSQSMY
jgi:hypothetical protein